MAEQVLHLSRPPVAQSIPDWNGDTSKCVAFHFFFLSHFSCLIFSQIDPTLRGYVRTFLRMCLFCIFLSLFGDVSPSGFILVLFHFLFCVFLFSLHLPFLPGFIPAERMMPCFFLLLPCSHFFCEASHPFLLSSSKKKGKNNCNNGSSGNLIIFPPQFMTRHFIWPSYFFSLLGSIVSEDSVSIALSMGCIWRSKLLLWVFLFGSTHCHSVYDCFRIVFCHLVYCLGLPIVSPSMWAELSSCHSWLLVSGLDFCRHFMRCSLYQCVCFGHWNLSRYCWR